MYLIEKMTKTKKKIKEVKTLSSQQTKKEIISNQLAQDGFKVKKVMELNK